ncbi:MAG: hypothetical protein IID41_05165 [Planctomycetes bacterium]|nr:hypothetical protein [Planctomycetota bacterium]
MTRQQATAEVFLTALKGLPRKDRDAVITKIAMDKTFARDILDLATITSRRKEPARKFDDYLKRKSG